MTELVNFIFPIMKISNFRHKLVFKQVVRFKVLQYSYTCLPIIIADCPLSSSSLDLFNLGSPHLSVWVSQSRGILELRPDIGVRVATVREKVLENEKFSRSGKSQGITFSVREI